MKKLCNSDLQNNLNERLKHLKPSQREDLKKVAGAYAHLFPDVPCRTDMIYHDAELEENVRPIKQLPYRKKIEPSKSNWSSPCVLVPKPDGSYPMCTEYRKVNKSDSFPVSQMEDCIDRIGNAKYVTKFDLLKAL